MIIKDSWAIVWRFVWWIEFAKEGPSSVFAVSLLQQKTAVAADVHNTFFGGDKPKIKLNANGQDNNKTYLPELAPLAKTKEITF